MPFSSSPNKAAFRYRHVGVANGASGPTMSRYHVAGMMTSATGMASNITAVAGTSYAIPFYTGAASLLESVNMRISTGVGASTGHVSIYTNTADNTLYPADRLGFSSDMATATSSAIIGSQVDIPVPPESLIWVVPQFSAAVAVLAVAQALQWPILGGSLDTTNYQYMGGAWLGAGSYGTPPTTYQNNAVPSLAAGYPAVYLRFSA